MNTGVYKYLLQTYGRNPWQWVGFVLELVRTLIFRVYIVIVMSHVTVSVAAGNFDGARRDTLYFLLAYISGALIGTLGEIISLSAENREYAKLAMAFHRKLIGKDLAFYRDHQTGYLTGLFRQHLDAMMLLLRFFRGEALGTTISLLVPPFVMFFLSPGVAFIMVTVICIQFLYVLWSSSKAAAFRRLAHEVYRKVTAEVSDVITNIVAFKSGGVERRADDNMRVLMDQETAAFQRRRLTTALLDLPRNIVSALGIAAAVYLIITTSSGAKPELIGLIVLALTYLFQMIRSIGLLPELVTNHDDLIAKAYPTLQYLHDSYEKILDPSQPVPLNVADGSVKLVNVDFSYASHLPDGQSIPVFSKLSLHIRGGERVGIVGLSGAGKSTLANLLLRFDEIDGGSIEIDGVDIRRVKQSDLRQSIAYVPQEPLLFHRSIRENIAYYCFEAKEEEIVRAAQAAHAHEFIEKLPQGYDTLVGERGIKLSGGQKQRVAIARAVLKKAPILLFDEATSALDSESERIIQQALPRIIGQQTAIIIAHRLSTVAGLDRIIVMHEGSVIETGSHEELLGLHGRYEALWKKQTQEF